MSAGVSLLKITIGIGLSFSTYLLASGPGNIRGRVLDAQTGNPMSNVNVIIVGTELGAATDNEGNFSLPHVEPGFYTLEISFVGYRTTRIDSLQVAGTIEAYLDIQLSQADIPMEPVTVSAIPYSQVITCGDVPTFCIKGTVSDSETLAPVPGVLVILSIRGGYSNRWAETDQTGAYRFSIGLVSCGPLRFSKVGYLTNTIEDVKFNVAVYDVMLERSRFEELCARVSPGEAGAISGKVTDRLDNPISGVHIILSVNDAEIGVVAATDENGIYNIQGLPPGKYDLEYLPVHTYKPYFAVDLTVKARHTSNKNVVLERIYQPYVIYPGIRIFYWISPFGNMYDWEDIMPERRY